VIVVTHDARVLHYGQTIAHMDDGAIVDVKRRDGPAASGGPAAALSFGENPA
jgi:ABC-type transport system involved in cytochrome bd biosynthesis fused ATPase/permease subunit